MSHLLRWRAVPEASKGRAVRLNDRDEHNTTDVEHSTANPRSPRAGTPGCMVRRRGSAPWSVPAGPDTSGAEASEKVMTGSGSPGKVLMAPDPGLRWPQKRGLQPNAFQVGAQWPRTSSHRRTVCRNGRAGLPVEPGLLIFRSWCRWASIGPGFI